MTARQLPERLTLHPIGAFTGGWFVGNFQPSLFPAEAVEIAVKYYKAGDHETSHVHRVATEFTVVTAGTVEINGLLIEAGVVARIPPGCPAEFRAVTDACTTVVKLPCVPGDKYPAFP